MRLGSSRMEVWKPGLQFHGEASVGEKRSYLADLQTGFGTYQDLPMRAGGGLDGNDSLDNIFPNKAAGVN
jgi:hypothetical protein